jgi:hypothetical protein
MTVVVFIAINSRFRTERHFGDKISRRLAVDRPTPLRILTAEAYSKLKNMFPATQGVLQEGAFVKGISLL